MGYKVGYPVGEGVYPIFKTEFEAKCLADYIFEKYDEIVEVTKTKEKANYIMKFMSSGLDELLSKITNWRETK